MKTINIIGAGASGLMAAQILGQQGFEVHVYDAMPSPLRKFLLAGRGGLNLTHNEDFSSFLEKYTDASENLKPHLEAFPPQATRDWCDTLGIETFVGTSGRVFPKTMKSSPLVRAWLKSLQNVTFHFKHKWTGFDQLKADATILALGGGSWARLGSTGEWVQILRDAGVKVHDLEAANCGFEVNWSKILTDKYAGEPLKGVTFKHNKQVVKGEAVITKYGVEGGAIYALSKPLRETLNNHEKAYLQIDFKPKLSEKEIYERLEIVKKGVNLKDHLRKILNLTPLMIALIYEKIKQNNLPLTPSTITKIIHNYDIEITKIRPIDKAISTAGGVDWQELDENLMLKKHKGVFIAGEMLNFDAPTGGYLLQAAFATGVAAAKGVTQFLSPAAVSN